MKNFKTLEWIGGVDGHIELIDQRRLPVEFSTLRCETVKQLYEAIKTLVVRGAPAIGVAAGFGICLAAQEISDFSNFNDVLLHLQRRADFLAQARPTAVNLFWSLDRMKTVAAKFVSENNAVLISDLRKKLLEEAEAIYDEDVEMCRQIGINGEKFIPDGGAILTHCNAGALATAGNGTALSPIFEAYKRGKRFKVYVDETRPLLQGARLTTWELQRFGIDVILICDNMAGALMKQGKIDIVITGADRIAANGDVANKIGTYSLSVLAGVHNIPFYIAAPSSTFDLAVPDGSCIPIEERAIEEVAVFNGIPIAPDGIAVYNPAFDITYAGDISAVITEKGIIEKPDFKKIALCFD